MKNISFDDFLIILINSKIEVSYTYVEELENGQSVGIIKNTLTKNNFESVFGVRYSHKHGKPEKKIYELDVPLFVITRMDFSVLDEDHDYLNMYDLIQTIAEFTDIQNIDFNKLENI